MRYPHVRAQRIKQEQKTNKQNWNKRIEEIEQVRDRKTGEE